MFGKDLFISGDRVGLHSCIVDPKFDKPTVLSSDPWDFVSLWLKQGCNEDASFYWEQARQFHEATLKLPSTSSSLTSFYCFLNAAKALLSAKGICIREKHGITGWSSGEKCNLKNEKIKFQGSGILPSFCDYLGENKNNNMNFNLKEILWNISFVHRAYSLTFISDNELFIPLLNPKFVIKSNNEISFFSKFPSKYKSKISKKSTIGYQFHKEKENITKDSKFKWDESDNNSDNLNKLKTFHKKIREKTCPIHSNQNRWYFKRTIKGSDKLQNSQLVLIYAAMHKLSDLTRYNPIRLRSHLKLQHNWLLSEFIKGSPGQFVHGIASEITGYEFIKPDSF